VNCLKSSLESSNTRRCGRLSRQLACSFHISEPPTQTGREQQYTRIGGCTLNQTGRGGERCLGGRTIPRPKLRCGELDRGLQLIRVL
jgi:hypothetical protein